VAWPANGLVETRAVSIEVEAHAGRGDHLDIEFGERDAGGSSGCSADRLRAKPGWGAPISGLSCALSLVAQHHAS
jgi:hypothetical protein